MLGDWFYWLIGGLLGAAGVVLALWSVFANRASGRKRCPKCWYDMSGIVGDPPHTCPECGKVIKRQKSLHKGRRRWWWAAAALIAVLVAGGLLAAPTIRRRGIQCIVPSTALILMIGYADSPWALKTLADRLEASNQFSLKPFIDTPVATTRHGLADWQWDLLHDELLDAAQASTDPYVRGIGLRLLECFELAQAPDGEALIAFLDDKDERVRRIAIRLLWQERLRDALNRQDTVDRLTALVDDPDLAVSVYAAFALTCADEHPDEALTTLLQMLESDDIYRSSRAASYLGRLRSRFDAVKPVLVRKLKDPSFPSLTKAASGLIGLGVPPAEIVPALVEALSSSDSERAVNAASYLGILEEDAAPALPELFDALDAGDPDLREMLCFAIDEILTAVFSQKPTDRGIALPDVREGIQRMLRHDDPDVALSAVKWIEPAEMDPRGAVPVLIDLLESKEPDHRASAARELGKMGYLASSALEPLRNLLDRDDDSEVREAARRAIVRIEGRY